MSEERGNIKITVAICTWNREKLLSQTLAKMSELSIPNGVEWELIIVNNNCTDNTDEVISRYSKCLPISRVFESNLGLSNARNSAVNAASGDYIVWTDDDVLVDKYWIQSYVVAFKNWPNHMIFGGPVIPWFEKEPPRWLNTVWNKVKSAYAVMDLGSEPIPIDRANLPFGANYAICLPIQKKYYYNSLLGRNGKSMIGGEETTLMLTILSSGYRGIWVPEAKVSHFIPDSRQTINYLRSYYRGQGLFLSLDEGPSSCVKIFGCPRWLIRAAITTEIRYRFHKLFSPPCLWIEHLIIASVLWGQIQGCYSRKR